MNPPSKRLRSLSLAAGALALIVYLVLGLSRITLDVDITRLLPQDLKETTGYRLFLKNFAGSEELIITLQGDEADAVEATAAELSRSLRDGQTPLARRVVWRSPFEPEAATHSPENPAPQTPPDLAEFLAWALLNQSPDSFAALEQRLAPGQIETTLARHLDSLATSLDSLDGLLGYDPLGLVAPLVSQTAGSRQLAPSLTSPDGRFRLVYVQSAEKLPNYKAMTSWLASVRAAAETVARPHHVAVHFTGEPAFVSEISSSMERDMKVSGGLALLLICLVVWLGYRNLRLLPVLVGMVALIFLLTLATSGLLLGSLTVLTVGCGSILIGLTVDYGVLLYAAKTARHPGDDPVPHTRRGILWAAATTTASFGALALGGMPGLAELGLLVALGVTIGATLFLTLFPRLLHTLHVIPPPKKSAPQTSAVTTAPASPEENQSSTALWIAALIMLGAITGLAVHGPPKMNLNSGSLRPRVSEAYTTLETLTTQLGGGQSSLSLLVAGANDAEVATRLQQLETQLETLKSQGLITSFTLPRSLWPVAATQQAHLDGPARRLANAAERLHSAVLTAGFTEDAFALSAQIFKHWQKWSASETAKTRHPFWPEAPSARWLLARFAVPHAVAATPSTQSLCLGLVQPHTSPPDAATLAALESLQTEGVYLAGSSLISQVMERHLSRNFFWLAITFTTITLGLLALALRRLRPFLLTLLCLTLAFSSLLGIMSWLNLEWNSFTLPALLLSLGTGSDYFIYVILELEKHGAIARMHQRLRRPLLVCVGASVCGFGSLAWAGNLGLSNLGRVCALALALNLLVALLVLPWLWRATRPVRP